MSSQRRNDTDFSDFVEHPRYGRGPRFTGLNPVFVKPKPGETYVHLHWHSSAASRIPDTAVVADVSKQKITTMGVTHYFDEIRRCPACDSQFIFFAEEQKYWYEDLGFTLEADCTHCVHCRKGLQELARNRRRYEELCHVGEPSESDWLEMADCCLTLIEACIFSHKQTAHVRKMLNRAREDECHELRRRLLAVEKSVTEPQRQ